MNYSTNTIHDILLQSPNYQTLMLLIFPCLKFLVEYTSFWKISASSTLFSYKKIFAFFSSDFFVWSFWFFYYYYYLELHSFLHFLLACTCTLALCCFTVKTGNSWYNRFPRTKHTFAWNISTGIWHLLYMEKLLKTTLRKESEEILSLASKTDVHMYIYRKWDSRQTHWTPCNTLLNLECSKSKNATWKEIHVPCFRHLTW